MQMSRVTGRAHDHGSKCFLLSVSNSVRCSVRLFLEGTRLIFFSKLKDRPIETLGQRKKLSFSPCICLIPQSFINLFSLSVSLVGPRPVTMYEKLFSSSVQIWTATVTCFYLHYTDSDSKICENQTSHCMNFK